MSYGTARGPASRGKIPWWRSEVALESGSSGPARLPTHRARSRWWWAGAVGLWVAATRVPVGPHLSPPPLIVNGAVTHGFGAVVGLQTGCEDLAAPHCTAVAVAPDWVLSAAHCIDDYDESFDPVVLADAVGQSGRITIPVIEIHPHPGYDGGPDWDVALLKLANPLPHRPLSLASVSPRDVVAAEVLAVGYGDTRLGLAESRRRKRVGTLSVAAATDQLLTLSPAPSMTCQGDSGGPILAQIEPNESSDPQPDRYGILGITVEGDPGCYEEGIAVTSSALMSWVAERVSRDAPGLSLASICPSESSAAPGWGGCHVSAAALPSRARPSVLWMFTPWILAYAYRRGGRCTLESRTASLEPSTPPLNAARRPLAAPHNRNPTTPRYPAWLAGAHRPAAR